MIYIARIIDQGRCLVGKGDNLKNKQGDICVQVHVGGH